MKALRASRVTRGGGIDVIASIIAPLAAAISQVVVALRTAGVCNPFFLMAPYVFGGVHPAKHQGLERPPAAAALVVGQLHHRAGLRDSGARLSTVAPLSGLIKSRQQREPITGRGALVSVRIQGLTITRLLAPLLLTATNSPSSVLIRVGSIA